MWGPGSLLQIENTSSIPLKFSMLLGSLSPYKERVRQKLPLFLTSQGKADLVGEWRLFGGAVLTRVKGGFGSPGLPLQGRRTTAA